ncbi:hypothetical protein KP509_27G022600 [Ceratopteris richardii]|nr:hypothetical protein KP509_27G022600 [Ceratopteris richardii]
MLERLNFELYQRKELCKQQELLEARKKMLQESIAARRKFLSSLPSHLKTLKKASLPVQQQLGILHTKRMKQHHLADLLPPPLYILYTQLSALKEAFNENIELEIIGSIKDAQALVKQQALKESGLNHGGNEENKIEEEIPEEEEELQRRRKRVKKSHAKESSDEGVYHSHPLTVVWHIFDEVVDGGKRTKLLSVRFEYLMRLNMVCAGVEGDRHGPLELLTNLFPDDTGMELPTQAAKLSAGVEFQYDVNRSCHPYKWAQHLAGVDFLSEVPPLVSEGHGPSEFSKATSIRHGLSAYRKQHRVQTVLEKLRSRKKAHLALRGQLDTLSNSKLPHCVYIEVPWGPYKSKCFLHSWAEVLRTGLPKPPASLDDAPSLNMVSSSAEGLEISPVNGLESLREDGELPSAAMMLTPASKVPKFSSLMQKKLYSVKERSHAKRVPFTQAKEAFTMLNNDASVDFKDLGALDDDDDMILEFAGSPMDNTNADDIEESTNFEKVSAWEECGSRTFNAVFRGEDSETGKIIDLEAQVKIFSEHPVRPPYFELRQLTDEVTPSLPSPPRGVLTVTEKAYDMPPSSLLAFSDLRAMEKEVNSGIIQLLPTSHENEILAQQLSMLAMLFDAYVDSRLRSCDQHHPPLSVGATGTTNVHELTARSIRGRDRQMQLC